MVVKLVLRLGTAVARAWRGEAPQAITSDPAVALGVLADEARETRKTAQQRIERRSVSHSRPRCRRGKQDAE
jgi:hypothetical protein